MYIEYFRDDDDIADKDKEPFKFFFRGIQEGVWDGVFRMRSIVCRAVKDGVPVFASLPFDKTIFNFDYETRKQIWEYGRTQIERALEEIDIDSHIGKK